MNLTEPDPDPTAEPVDAYAPTPCAPARATSAPALALALAPAPPASPRPETGHVVALADVPARSGGAGAQGGECTSPAEASPVVLARPVASYRHALHAEQLLDVISSYSIC